MKAHVLVHHRSIDHAVAILCALASVTSVPAARATRIVIDPHVPTTVYASAPCSGVSKSTDGATIRHPADINDA